MKELHHFIEEVRNSKEIKAVFERREAQMHERNQDSLAHANKIGLNFYIKEKDRNFFNVVKLDKFGREGEPYATWLKGYGTAVNELIEAEANERYVEMKLVNKLLDQLNKAERELNRQRSLFGEEFYIEKSIQRGKDRYCVMAVAIEDCDNFNHNMSSNLPLSRTQDTHIDRSVPAYFETYDEAEKAMKKLIEEQNERYEREKSTPVVETSMNYCPSCGTDLKQYNNHSC